MSIDWITVAAQIANFLVLVWLLKRFLYRPILDGIDAREAQIASRMEQVIKAQDSAAATEAAYHDQMRALNVAQTEMAETVRKTAEHQRDALLKDAQQRMEQERMSFRANLDQERRKYTARMHRAGAEALLALTRKALLDLADETLEARMAQHLVRQIDSVADDLKHAAGEAGVAKVTSHDPLSPDIQAQLVAIVRSHFPQATVEFDTDTDQAPGLVLRIGGAQLSWTVDSYIEGLNALIGQRLASGSDPKVHLHDR